MENPLRLGDAVVMAELTDYRKSQCQGLCCPFKKDAKGGGGWGELG